MDYGSYYVDPLRYQQAGMNNLARSAAFKADKDSMLQSQARMDRQENRLSQKDALEREKMMYERGRQERQDKMSDTANKLKLFQYQVDFLGQGLDSVSDDKSYQSFRSIVGQMADSGMLEPMWYEKMPESYDPSKVKEAKGAINAFKTKIRYTLREGETRFEGDEKVAYNPKTYNPESKKEKTKDKYSTSQQIKDLLNEYKEYKSDMVDELGDPDQKRIQQLNRAHARDKKLIRDGKAPHFMGDLIGGAENKAVDDGLKESHTPGVYDTPKTLTRDLAIDYMRKANGDKEKAKQLAMKDGYQF